MTEEEWLKGRHAQAMVWVLRGTRITRTKIGKRKLRLFACGCCRAAWAHLPDVRLGRAIEVAERFADGLATKDELANARRDVEWMTADGALPTKMTTEAAVAVDMAVASTDTLAFEAAFYMTATQAPLAGQVDGEVALCHLVRCAFGNPFRPFTLARAQRTTTVASLAHAAYHERQLPSGELEWDRLAVLADALEEAGAADEMVAHLRGPGPHVRGCHVIDLCLGLT